MDESDLDILRAHGLGQATAELQNAIAGMNASLDGYIERLKQRAAITFNCTWDADHRPTCGVCSVRFAVSIDESVPVVREEHSGLTLVVCPACLAALAPLDDR